MATAWSVDHLPAVPGRDADGIVAALQSGAVSGLVVGGIDPDDTADPAATRSAIAKATFVVALDLRETEITRVADVVFPVAPASDKAGTFVTWDGRPRSFDAVFTDPTSLPDLRILAGISEELGKPLGFRAVSQVRAEMESLGPWDGARAASTAATVKKAKAPAKASVALASWKQMIDLGSMQDGEEHLRATARRAEAVIDQVTFDAVGPEITITGDRGSVTLPARVADDMVSGVVWVPANSFGNGVLADLASPGSRVTLKGAVR